MSMFDQNPGGGPSAASELATLQAEAEAEAAPPAVQEVPPGPPADAAAGAVAPAGTGDGDGDEAGDDTRQVPLRALKDERARRRVLEEQIAAYNQQVAAAQQQHQAQAQPEAPPDPDEDPIAALRYERQQREQLQQYLQAQAVQQRVTQDYIADAQRFAARTPDFAQAYNHLFSGRVAELRSQGWQDDAIRAQVQREEFNIALGALRAGRSPAQQAYDLARARGYVAAASRPAGQGGTDPALATLKARAAASISDGGAGPRGDLSLEDIGRLNGPAFDAAFERYTRTQGRRSSLFRSE